MPLRPGPPPPTLMAELMEVATQATALKSAVVGANYLPDDFPADALADLCSSLVALPVGSAEGCRVPLEYARLRLPAVRREFVLIVAKDGPDSEPRINRGDYLDQCLGGLIAATTTALDEYRFLAASSPSDEADVSASYDAAPAGVGEAIEHATRAVESLDRASAEFDKMRNANSARADVLARSIRDASVLSTLARVELQMRKVVAKWLRNLAGVLRATPAALRSLGSGIRVTADLAAIALGRWSDFWSNFERFVLSEIAETGDAVVAVADRLEKNKKVERATIPWQDASDFNRWVAKFVEENTDDAFGVSYHLLVVEVSGITGEKANNLARKFGHKNLMDVVRTGESVRILRGTGGVIYLSTSPPETAHRIIENNIQSIVRFIEAALDSYGFLTTNNIARRVRDTFRPRERIIAYDGSYSIRDLLRDNATFVMDYQAGHEVWRVRERQANLPFLDDDESQRLQ